MLWKVVYEIGSYAYAWLDYLFEIELNKLLDKHGILGLHLHAASTGQLDVLQWIINKYSHIQMITTENIYFDGSCRKAAYYGHLHILEWMASKSYLSITDTDICAAAALGGNLHILQWLRLKGCSWNADTCHGAAEYGHLDVLKWAHEKNGCPWNSSTCASAALGGHLHILQYLRAHNCSWDTKTCKYAAERGHLHIIKWAVVNGCQWDEWVFFTAMNYRQYHILRWSYEQGINFDGKILKRSEEFHHINDMEWLHDRHGYFKTMNLKEMISQLNAVLLDIIHIPDLVRLIKCYI